MSYSGNLLVENRNGLIVDAEVFQANGTAERDAALIMLEQIAGKKPVSVGGDKGFDTRDFVKECRHMRVAARGAEPCKARERHYVSPRDMLVCPQSKEKADRECFAAEDHRADAQCAIAVCKVHWIFTFACAAYNLAIESPRSFARKSP